MWTVELWKDLWSQSVSPHHDDETLRRVKKELTNYKKAEKGNVSREAENEAGCREKQKCNTRQQPPSQLTKSRSQRDEPVYSDLRWPWNDRLRSFHKLPFYLNYFLWIAIPCNQISGIKMFKKKIASIHAVCTLLQGHQTVDTTLDAFVFASLSPVPGSLW